MRELAVACSKDLLRALPERFRAFTEHVLLRLLGAGKDEAHTVAVGAEEVRGRARNLAMPERPVPSAHALRVRATPSRPPLPLPPLPPPLPPPRPL